jgi:hypothetical protein
MREDVRVEVEDDAVVLVLPRKMDTFITPWQDARRLGEVLERAAKDVPRKVSILDPQSLQRETEQVRLGSYKTNVTLIFNWADRIRLSPHAAIAVAQAIKIKSQDVELEGRGVRMRYTREGRPRPVQRG